jgi:hypothetical protein
MTDEPLRTCPRMSKVVASALAILIEWPSLRV